MRVYIDFSFVKENANFETLCKHYNIKLIGSGDERRAICPFHDDENPSLSINLKKKVYKCHAASCGENGKVLDFVAALEGSDLRDACMTIAEICEISLAKPKAKTGGKYRPGKSAGKPKSTNKRKTTQKKEPEPTGENVPLSFQLHLDPEHPYGVKRSFSSSVTEMFEMGFSNRGSMKDRWCVPIHNINGDIVAYIGRYAIGKKPKNQPKWKLPAQFNKSLELFNMHRLVGHTDHVVLVEGVFDAIRLHTLAVPVVGLLGSSISREQIELLKQAGVTRVMTMLDGEADKAEAKLVSTVAREIFVRSIKLPGGEDPDSVSEEFLLDHVEPLMA